MHDGSPAALGARLGANVASACMRLRLFGLLVAAAVLPSSATAAPVVVFLHSGRTVVRDDPFLSRVAITPPSAARAETAGPPPAPVRFAGAARAASTRSVTSRLAAMARGAKITHA